MWEHRSVSDKSFKETNILPNETYVKLMDEVEAVVARLRTTSSMRRPS